MTHPFEVFDRAGEVKFIAEIKNKHWEHTRKEIADLIDLCLAVEWAIERGISLAGCNLSGLIASHVHFPNGIDLSNTDLSESDFLNVDLYEANLSGANLTNSLLKNAGLFWVNVSGAIFSGADFVGASLVGTSLIDGGQRSDGDRFVGWIKDGCLMIQHGGYSGPSLSIEEIRERWQHDGYLCAETLAILDHIEAVYVIRKLGESGQP